MSLSGEVAVVRQLAEVSEAFIGLAATLRSLPAVKTASHPCWMRTEERTGEDQHRVGRGVGFRVEWYAEAEFEDGSAISFGQELSWHDGEWTIDASVRVNDDQGPAGMRPSLQILYPSCAARLGSCKSRRARESGCSCRGDSRIGDRGGRPSLCCAINLLVSLICGSILGARTRLSHNLSVIRMFGWQGRTPRGIPPGARRVDPSRPPDQCGEGAADPPCPAVPARSARPGYSWRTFHRVPGCCAFDGCIASIAVAIHLEVPWRRLLSEGLTQSLMRGCGLKPHGTAAPWRPK